MYFYSLVNKYIQTVYKFQLLHMKRQFGITRYTSPWFSFTLVLP